MNCVRCGKVLKEGSRFCDGCGAAQAPAPPMHPQAPGSYPSHGYGEFPGMRPGPLPAAGGSGPWKKIIAISLCVVVVALLAIGGVFAYLKISEPSRKLSQARGAYEDGDYTLAVDLCDEIIDKWPDKSQADEAGTLLLDAYFLEGERRLAEGGVSNYAAAEEIFDYLVEEEYPDQQALDSDRFNLYIVWAGELKTTYEYEEAVVLYDKAASIAALGAEQLYSRVECLYQWGEQLKAVPSYQEASAAYKRCYDEDPAGPFSEPAYTSYIDMTVAAETGAAPPSKEPSAGGKVQVNIKNTGASASRLFLSGPTTSIVELGPGQSTVVYVLPGTYNTCLTDPEGGFKPYSEVGAELTMTSGAGWYEWTLYEQ